MNRTAATLIVSSVLVAATAHVLDAQPRRPRAELTPVAAKAPVRAGTNLTLQLKVTLPADVHVQSNKPRDPSLIPTVLTVDAVEGVQVEEIIYPPATDFAQQGQSKPLAVYGPEFTIDVRLTLAATVTAGAVTIPARLRYQACDRSVCYPPTRGDAQWTLTVEPHADRDPQNSAGSISQVAEREAYCASR